MTQYIDKEALVAEIERQISAIDDCPKITDTQISVLEGDKVVLTKLLSFIDTLEVREVDLEKIINDYFKDWQFDDELDIMVKPNNYSASFTDLKKIAKHFFELGINAV